MWNEQLPGKPALIELLSWPALAEMLDAGIDMLLLPIGATEQHGPHLPVNTDTTIASAVCAYASAKTHVPVLPAIAYGVSVGHTTKWPGTFSLDHETLIATIRNLAIWTMKTGWKRLLIVNAHFGNDASLRVAVDRVRTEFLGQIQIGVKHTYQLTPEIWNYFISDADDLHANCAETDLMLHLAPDTVRMDWVEDDPDRTNGLVFSYPVSQTSLNGITGTPSLGSAERGAELFREMGEALARVVIRARTEQPPLPQDHWSDTSVPY
jgi:creatinine amidohydrolase